MLLPTADQTLTPTNRRTAPRLAAILSAWRDKSASHPLLWNDRTDLLLIRSLISGEGLAEALGAFAEAVADTGAHLTECCAHLGALTDVLRAQRDVGASLELHWDLVPRLVEPFSGNPQGWGFDPLTGCVSGPFLSAALGEYYRRAKGSSLIEPGDWSMIAVKLSRAEDLATAVITEFTACHVITNAVRDVDLFAHVQPGVFALVGPTSQVARQSRDVREALLFAGVGGDVSTFVLPATLTEARHLVIALSRRDHRPQSLEEGSP